MAFQAGTVTTYLGWPADFQPFRNFVRMSLVSAGQSLLTARVGAYDATGAATDSGQFTTAAVAAIAGEIIITPAPASGAYTFGRGPAAWLTGDENLIQCTIYNRGAEVQGGIGQFPELQVAQIAWVAATGDIVVGIHNTGAQATAVGGTIIVDIEWRHTIVN